MVTVLSPELMHFQPYTHAQTVKIKSIKKIDMHSMSLQTEKPCRSAATISNFLEVPVSHTEPAMPSMARG